MMNLPRLRASFSVRLLAIGLTLSAGVAMQAEPAHATAVTIGGNYQEGSDRTSTRVPTAGSCGVSTDFCHVIFNVVPAGKQLLITDVSCRFVYGAPAPDSVHSISLDTWTAANQQTDRRHNFIPTRTAESSSIQIYTAVAATRQILKSGERPVVTMLSAGGRAFQSVRCSISGKVGNPPTE